VPILAHAVSHERGDVLHRARPARVEESGVEVEVGYLGFDALAAQRRCTVQLERNVLSKTPQRLRGRMAREVSRIFDAPSAGEAKARLEQLKLGLGKQLPEAMACLVAGFAAATQFYAFPKAHWRRIRSTNGLERLHGEIKRRIRVVGAFPDRASALRLITAVALHVTSIWGDRRYLDLSKEITRKAA